MTAVAVGALALMLSASSLVAAVGVARADRLVAGRVADLRAAASGAGLDRTGSRRAAAAVAAALAGLVVSGAVLAGVGAVAALAAPAIVARRRAAAAESRAADALADVVDDLGRAIRAGAPPVDALRAVARGAPRSIAAGLRSAANEAERGVPLTAAIDGWAADRGPDGAELVATAVAVTSATGGDAGRCLVGVADTLRDRRARRREVRALSSQARLSAAFIGVAPVAFAAVTAAVDDRSAAALLGTPLGLACLVAGGALDAAGWWWMDRITRSVG